MKIFLRNLLFFCCVPVLFSSLTFAGKTEGKILSVIYQLAVISTEDRNNQMCMKFILDRYDTVSLRKDHVCYEDYGDAMKPLNEEMDELNISPEKEKWTKEWEEEWEEEWNKKRKEVYEKFGLLDARNVQLGETSIIRLPSNPPFKINDIRGTNPELHEKINFEMNNIKKSIIGNLRQSKVDLNNIDDEQIAAFWEKDKCAFEEIIRNIDCKKFGDLIMAKDIDNKCLNRRTTTVLVKSEDVYKDK